MKEKYDRKQKKKIIPDSLVSYDAVKKNTKLNNFKKKNE